MLRVKVANFIVATGQCCYGSKLLQGQSCYGSKLLRTKLLRPENGSKLLIAKKSWKIRQKDANIRTAAEAKNPPVHWLWWFPLQSDQCCHTMSIVHIFTTSMGGKQARDEHGFTYYLNRNHEKVTYWRCSKKGCLACMVSRNSTSMLVGEQLPQHDHTTNLLKKKAKEEESSRSMPPCLGPATRRW